MLFPAENLGAALLPPKSCSGEAFSAKAPKLRNFWTKSINRTETETKLLPTEFESRFFSAGFQKSPSCRRSSRVVSLPPEFQSRRVAAGIPGPFPCCQSWRAVFLPTESRRHLVIARFPEQSLCCGSSRAASLPPDFYSRCCRCSIAGSLPPEFKSRLLVPRLCLVAATSLMLKLTVTA